MNVSGEFAYTSPNQITYGPGSRQALPAALEAAGVERVLLLVSNSLYEKTPHGKELEDLIGSRRALTFSQPRQHVPREVVVEVARQARAASVDAIVSLGGGSVSDLGKAVGLAIAENITDSAAIDDYKVTFTSEGEVRPTTVAGSTVPHWTLPTTLSAAEFTSGFGITDAERGVKDGFSHSTLIPQRVILDSELTRSTPMDLWLSTGIRALDHCVEACYSLAAQPFVTAVCKDGLATLAKYLGRTRSHPEDLDARTYCQIASWQGGFAITNAGVGVSHAVGHQIGARYGIPHGITSCVTLPAAMAYNNAVVGDVLDEIASIFGAPAGVSGADAVRSFIADLGLPTRLDQVGLGPENYDQIVADVSEDRSILWNPRPIDGEAVVEILEIARTQ
ncbi:iron-containing alcohol dehydrogenase [Nocardia sp. CA2R105]|nr:iron-containing alcohol dehydrogenase [Nocardia coffeae]